MSPLLLIIHSLTFCVFICLKKTNKKVWRIIEKTMYCQLYNYRLIEKCKTFEKIFLSLTDEGRKQNQRFWRLLLVLIEVIWNFAGKIITMVQAWSIIAWAPGDIRRPDLTVFGECKMRPIGTGDLGNYLDILYVQSKWSEANFSFLTSLQDMKYQNSAHPPTK